MDAPKVSGKTFLTIDTGERVYEFSCAQNAPLGEIHDALVTMKTYIVGLIVDNQKKETQPAEE
jgi:hypothetical protein